MLGRNYMDSVHLYGRIWTVTALLVMLMIPISISAYLGVWPEANIILKGLAPVALIFYPSAVVEVISYSPMMGAGATYLGFVTGNITNLKMPCALNAMENAGVKSNTEEGEVISTISVATSSIVTTAIIALGVLLFSPVLPYLTDESSPFAPAFQQVVPALFGALGATYFAKHWKISILPIAVILICLGVKGDIGIGVLIPIGLIVSLVGAHIMYKKKLV
mgnify:CR=1 FL=1